MSDGRITTSITLDAAAHETLVLYCDSFTPKKNRSRFVERLIREFFSKEEIIQELKGKICEQNAKRQSRTTR
jgi:hypothetical protein